MQHKKSIYYYSASSLYMFRVSTTPIIRRTQTSSGTGHNFCAATSLQRDQASLATFEKHSMTSTGGCSYHFVYPL